MFLLLQPGQSTDAKDIRFTMHRICLSCSAFLQCVLKKSHGFNANEAIHTMYQCKLEMCVVILLYLYGIGIYYFPYNSVYKDTFNEVFLAIGNSHSQQTIQIILFLLHYLIYLQYVLKFQTGCWAKNVHIFLRAFETTYLHSSTFCFPFCASFCCEHV